MRNFIISKLFLSVLAVFLLVIFAQTTVYADNSLDGKTFSVKVSENGKDGEARDDELIFKDGTFFSTDCEQYGFSPAAYESQTRGDITMFGSLLKSEKEGEAWWEGKIEGDSVEGRMVWVKKGQDQIVYKFKGSLKK